MRSREWLKSTDPIAMLSNVQIYPELLAGKNLTARRRQHILFVLAAARGALQRVDNPTCYAAAKTAYRVAEGLASQKKLRGCFWNSTKLGSSYG
jgi:hypothetical protein